MSDGGTLRDQQAEFTKQLLLEAARQVILNGEPDEFTMQKVAKQAGVSHRTVYRYFPSRQELIDEFSEWMERQFEPTQLPPEQGIRRAGSDLREVFSRFDRHSEFFEAAARMSGGTLRPANQAQRTAQMREVFDAEFPDLDPDVADKSFAIIRLLVGLQTWYTLRERFGLRDGETGDAVAWAIEVLAEALHEGCVPENTTRAGEDATHDHTGDE